MEAQERIDKWSIWLVIVLSWLELFLILALMFRTTGCNRSSELGTRSTDIIAESASVACTRGMAW